MGTNAPVSGDDLGAPPSQRDGRGWRGTAIEALAVTALALIAAALLLNLWDADLSVPFEYGGDANFYAGMAKTLDAHPWYLDTPELGWPVGSQLYDLPLGNENLQYAALKSFTLFTGWAEAMNLYYLASFPLVALSAYFVARRYAALSVGISLTLALLYAFLPYHFARGIDHLPFANYAAVPLACALILSVANGGITWPPWRMPRRRLLGIGAICLLLASTSAYYGVFAALLIVGVSAIASLAERDWRRVAVGGAVAFVLGVFMLANLAPSLVFWAANGRQQIGERPAADSERFGLRAAELVLPISEHRFEPFADIGGRARAESAVPGEHGAGLGLIGAGGLVVAVGSLLIHGARRGDRARRATAPAPPEPADLGLPILLALLIGLVGGLAFVLALFGFDYLRGWNRISVFIGFFALLAAGHVLTRLQRWSVDRRLPRHAFSGLLAVLWLVGLLDQTPVHPVPAYAGTQRAFAADAAFVTSIEDSLGEGSSVFQIPIVPYPEAGTTVGMPDYDHIRGYLHSDTLRWSYGASKGRDDVWIEELKWLGPVPLVLAAAAIGFDAVWVDRSGFTDPFAVEDALVPVLGQPMVSADRRLALYELEGLARRLRAELGPEGVERLRNTALHPLTQRAGEGFLDPGPTADPRTVWAGPDAVLHVHNPSDNPRPAVVTGRLAEAPARVRVAWSDGAAVLASAPPGGAPGRMAVEVVVPPGDSEIRFSTDAEPRPVPGGGQASFRVLELDIGDSAANDAARELGLSIRTSADD